MECVELHANEGYVQEAIIRKTFPNWSYFDLLKVSRYMHKDNSNKDFQRQIIFCLDKFILKRWKKLNLRSNSCSFGQFVADRGRLTKFSLSYVVLVHQVSDQKNKPFPR